MLQLFVQFNHKSKKRKKRKEKNEKNLLTETKQDGNINFVADDVAKQTSKKMLKKIKKVVDKE